MTNGPYANFSGSDGGGIWRLTTDGWENSDQYLGAMAVSDLKIDRTDENTIYAATGRNYRNFEFGISNFADLPGSGIFRSTDGGARWERLPATQDWEVVNKISINPLNRDVLLAATSQGLYRTTDRGQSWTQLLPGYATSVAFTTSSGQRAVVAIRDEGIYTTSNGGNTWSHSTGAVGSRIEIAASKTMTATVYAVTTGNNELTLWKSTNNGVTFNQAAAAPITADGDRFAAVYVDPLDPNRVFFGSNMLYRSDDGGATATRVFSTLPGGINGIDQGFDSAAERCIFVSTEFGNYRIPDFLTTTVQAFNNRFCTANITSFEPPRVPTQSWACTTPFGSFISTTISIWTKKLDEPGSSTVNDPTDKLYSYGSSTRGRIYNSLNNHGALAHIYNTGSSPITDTLTDSSNRYNVICLDPNDPNRLYACFRRLWRTTSPRTTNPDWTIVKEAIPDNGELIGADDSRNISAIAIAKGNSDRILVGHNNGQIWRSQDGTAAVPTWTRIDLPSMPKRWVSRIVIDPTNQNRIFVSFLGWEPGNLWRSIDGGTSWEDVATGRLPSAPINTVFFSPFNVGDIFIGTDVGVFATEDGGTTWSTSNEGPGALPVRELNWWYSSQTLEAQTFGGNLYATTIGTSGRYESPQAFSVISGSSFKGVLADVYRSDNRAMSVSPNFATARNAPQIEIEFRGSIGNTYNWLASAFTAYSSTSTLSYCMAMYNYTTGEWVESPRYRPDTSLKCDMQTAGTIADFRSPTGEIKSRVRFYFDPDGGRGATIYLDRVAWGSGN